ncbi:MAG: diacylglycerol kinase family protein [Sphingobacteriaceae bacterium]|jgi:undecaprenol kinase/diacylglycerol kinase (ATP)|nr:diacylglycerol kinase family protein [Sphingobacteriaceae bacterium]
MRKVLKGFVYAFNGLGYAVRTQVNFQIHLVSALAAICLGLYFDISKSEWMSICLCIGLVLIFELLNTALEAFVDLVSPEYNVKAGIVKDVAAASVLVTAMLSVAIGLFIFLPKLIDLWQLR